MANKEKNLIDIFSSLMDQGVPEQEASKIVDNLLKSQQQVATKDIQTGGTFNPSYGPLSIRDLEDVTDKELDIARKSAQSQMGIGKTVPKPPVMPPNVQQPVVPQPDLSKVKPIYSNQAEELAAKLNSLPGNVKEKVLEAFPRLRASIGLGAEQAMDAVSKVSRPIMKAAGPIASAYSMAEGSKAGGELFGNYDNLSTKQKIGKGLKTIGGGAAASAIPIELMSGGLATPAALVLGLGGTGLYGLGEYLDQPDAPPTTPPAPPAPVEEKKVEPLPYKNIVKDLSDEELSDILNYQGDISYFEEPPKEFKAPSVDEIKRKAVDVANEVGLSPASFLSQVEQESSFSPFAISKTGAKGLGQMFPAAFTDAKKMDTAGVLKGIEYRDMIKPENWVKQLYASALYNKWIEKYKTKGAGDEARLKWYAGGSNPEKAKEQGTDVNEYVKLINKRIERNQKWIDTHYNKQKEPTAEATPEAQQAGRTPSSTPTFDANFNANLKFDDLNKAQDSSVASGGLNEKQQQILNWLRQDTNNMSMGGAGPLVYAPYANTEEGATNYSRALTDRDRLMDLKRRFDEATKGKPQPYLFDGKLTKEDELPVDEEKLFNPPAPPVQGQEEAVVIPREVIETSRWKGAPFIRPDLKELEGKRVILSGMEAPSASPAYSAPQQATSALPSAPMPSAPAGEAPVAPSAPSATPTMQATPSPMAPAPSGKAPVPTPSYDTAKVDDLRALLSALRTKDQYQSLADMSRALNQITHGIVGMKSKSKVENLSDKLMESQGKEFDGGVANLSAAIKMREYQEENDPNSGLAKNMRDVLAKAYENAGMVVPDFSKMSFDKMHKIHKELGDIIKYNYLNTKAEKAEERREETQKLKLNKEQGTWLQKAQTELSKSEDLKARRIFRDALQAVKQFRVDKNSLKSSQLAYAFAKIGDPNTGVRDSELKLFANTGSALQQLRENARLISTGTISDEKAADFQKLLEDGLARQEFGLKERLEPIENFGAEQYNLPKDKIRKILLGDTVYEHMYGANEQLNKVANAYYESPQFKQRFPDDAARKRAAQVWAEKSIGAGRLK